ncbi:myb-like HTH transcriptional regulator family protein [Raphanus sativus]|nr:myb-like HTH transcriptional regulator family protein [Raphanus sativus]
MESGRRPSAHQPCQQIYGPCDWSSIRSKGLLQRTGKSCRLRWVNKLRPNLKKCKFSADEERTVIELQAEFGNKWARIATYLPGRTDNDVKNFWSSRIKRLARILRNSSDASSSSNPKPSSHRNKGKNVKPIQSLYATQEDITAPSSSSKILPYSSSDQNDHEALRLPELGIKLEHKPLDLVLAETAATPLMSEFHNANQQAVNSNSFSSESIELLARLDNPYYYDILGPADSSEPLFVLPQPVFEPSPMPRSCSRHVSKDDEADVFLDDFPEDMFDQVDYSNPSP